MLVKGLRKTSIYLFISLINLCNGLSQLFILKLLNVALSTFYIKMLQLSNHGNAKECIGL